MCPRNLCCIAWIWICNGQCNHEEADTRIVLHIRHALERGAETVLVRTVDTDVVVILVGKLHDLLAYNQHAKVWVAFGMGRHFSIISINTSVPLLEKLGHELYQSSTHSLGVTVLHSSVASEKKTAWRAWELNSQVTPALQNIATHPFQQLTVSSENSQKLERFTIIMYDRSSPLASVNDTQLMLFSKRNRDLDNIPPTQVYINNVLLTF